MKEREIIAALGDRLARSPLQRNDRYASDAEIVEIGGSLWAITIDEFSAEDRLPSDDPALLGWNLVTATISDLLAAGARPRFMLNSLVVPPRMDRAFLMSLSSGMQSALSACGAHMLGGDVGTGDSWRFTGVALGDFEPARAPLSRITSCEGGSIYASGSFGGANAAAAGAGPAPRFELRLAESAALAAAGRHEEGRRAPGGSGRESARAASRCAGIDTSDGLVGAFETLCACDPAIRVEIDLSAVPFSHAAATAAAALDVPREVFLLGSAGEYEIVALIPEDARPAVEGAGMRRIGVFSKVAGEPASTASGSGERAFAAAGLFFRRGAALIAHPGLPDPRACASFDEYRAALVALARRLFDAPAAPAGAGS